MADSPITYTRRGLVFTLAGSEPCTRRDGSTTAIYRWTGTCVICGGAFEVTTPIRSGLNPKSTHAFDLRTCKAHRGQARAHRPAAQG